MLGEREFEDKILHLGYYFNLLIYDATFLTHEYIADFFISPLQLSVILTLALNLFLLSV